ncbi:MULTISPECIES: glycoside hydrolase [unclassified Streptomyces]|uniref:glycoside hydrolase n=1 Tax=unclassified Streptomyces TaxID=2593676 RepID=UPI002365F9DF|nr:MULTISPECIES: glycoside hydrolase [unclassified Streptomyces]MDF3143537.1 RICIN domain-containing protein [Streptomyces sp. T21Q-yed]WDF43757.1 RICIN domain-containing protein [Streptomyces sp. T12]
MPQRHRIVRALASTVPLVLGASLVAAAPVASAADPAPRSAVTVRIDPSYQQQEFEGWGTSLVWFANATGGYPEPIRRRLVDMLFGADGLRLNIARYNIGGGNAPDVRKDYMKAGATMEGFWKAPEGTTQKDMDWWDPNNPDHWNWDADAGQRWWVDQIKDKVTRWEAFSNSPPWFQTVSGYVSGGFDASADQIRADRVDDFATYLVRVSERLEQAHGIEFDTVDPLNEPNTPYWGTQIGADGRPTGGRQEGAHAGPELQQKVVLALDKALDGARTGAEISAMDETNPGIFTQNWNAYGTPARAAVDQLNVHTYGTGQRTSARDIAKGADKKLWMSEVEGTWGTGTDFTGMEPGLGIATRMVDDMRELEPSAWVFWQPIEDAIPQAAAGKNWGSIHVPFNCTAEDTLETCPVRANSKFHTIRNFTHYIRPGDHFVKADDPSSVAAVQQNGRTATVVHVNGSTSARSVTLDLSRFGKVAPRATVTPVVTSSDGALVRGTPVRVTDRSATLTVPAKSVTTFLVEGVGGVARDAALVQPGHVYRLQGAQSGKSLAPSDDGNGVVIRTTDAESAEQLWSVRQLTPGTDNRERYALTSAKTGKRLAVRDDQAVLEEPESGPVPEAAQWIMSTTGDGTWTFVNAATGRLADVAGQSTADGAKVSTYTPTSAANQRWTVTDETVLRTARAEAFTVPGLRPELPTTVTPVFRDGARGALPVVWNLPPDRTWRDPGTVRVRGEATDALGRKVPALAVVTVDTIASTLPGRAKTYVGGTPDLPATVVGVGRNGGRADLPVAWDPAPDGAFDATGTVTLRGVAQVVGGDTVHAAVRVQVTEPVETNIAADDGVSVDATFTESGYSAERLRNGDLSEKAWSNWKPGNTKNPSDSVTFTLPKPRDLNRVVAHFYRDGSSASFPESLKVQVRASGTGTWVDAGDPVAVGTEGTPVVDVPLETGPASQVRVVMTARQGGYLTMSEIEVYAKSPGVSSDAAAASVEVSGKAIPSFDPDTATYRVVTDAPSRSRVTATTRDPYATVAVDRLDEPGGAVAVVSVTSEDGSRTRTYRIHLVRR